MLEHLDNLAEASSRAISNIKFDKVVVWENGGHDGVGSTAGFLQNMARTLPPMLQIMQDIGGVKMPEYFGKMVEPGDARAATANGPSAPGAPGPVARAPGTAPLPKKADGKPPVG